MGFCLFEDADYKGIFLAVNCLYIEDCKPLEIKGGKKVCCISFSVDHLHDVRVIGEPEEIDNVISDASKIGLQKSKLNLLNKLSSNPTPLLINNPGRIVLVREMQPETFMQKNNSITTASQLYFEDGKKRFISERPGRFVVLTNQGGQVPILKTEE